MKRWDRKPLLALGLTLFKKIYKRKVLCGHNHDIHFLAREINSWLPESIELLRTGQITPRFLKRITLPDEVVDTLHLTDRILQYLVLKIIKPTFKHVMNPNCMHLLGPSGVKHATERVRGALESENSTYFIRADIKSFYKSIVHFKLIQDLKKHYHDPKLLSLLEDIITNPIETPNGTINPITGIALRGPLSQFFSGLYLKPLDDAFNTMDVTYIRFQDDVLILCKSKRQWCRCKRIMKDILHERYLKLSRRKTRMGKIGSGFHFLGISYSQTQTEDGTHTESVSESEPKQIGSETQKQASFCITPHARTLRKARENVKSMVADDVSRLQIRRYLYRWLCWWANTSKLWSKEQLLHWFIESCWDKASF